MYTSTTNHVIIADNLASKYPDIAKEWHPNYNGDLTPDKVAPHSNKKVWWLCQYGHTYETTPDKRVGRGAGCPYCSGKKVLAGYNDLATKVPSLAAEWDYDHNLPLIPQAVTSNSHKKVWWKCKNCDFEWQATINDRYRHRGCPACAVSIRTKKRLKTMLKPGQNDFASQRPNLVPEWSVMNGDAKPENFTVNSNFIAWWKCSVCGNEWQASISNRANNNSGCPKCMRYKGTSFPEQALYYYFKMVYPDTVNGYKGCFDTSKMELDLYIPEINTGVEYDGVAWHSNKRSRIRDENKYKRFFRVLLKNAGGYVPKGTHTWLHQIIEYTIKQDVQFVLIVKYSKVITTLKLRHQSLLICGIMRKTKIFLPAR